jgi:hemerythrin-like domain-containing protein
MANAIELIKADHKKVEQLYQRYQGSSGQSQPQRALIQEMCQELTIHAQLEEELFYPAVERQLGKEGATLGTEARKEHREMKRAMSQLQAQEFAGPQSEQVFQDMMQGVQHHVQEEEREMLPKAQQQLGAESDRLGALMQQQKQELQKSKHSGEKPREASRA